MLTEQRALKIRSNLDRFVSIVPITGCWMWMMKIDRHGYGCSWGGASKEKAHRVFYTLFVGPIRDGMTIDHLCRNRWCVNPAHLEQVTGRENGFRGQGFHAVNARKTHCVNGHLLDGENLGIGRNPHWQRFCRTCRREKANARQKIRRMTNHG